MSEIDKDIGQSKDNILPEEGKGENFHERFKILSEEKLKNLSQEELLKYSIDSTERIKSIENLVKELKDRTLRDPLTQSFNKEGIFTEVERIMKEGSEFSLFFIDLGNFKEVNDEFGHQTGDKVLMEFSQDLNDVSLRTDDIHGRYGGDEFVVILPNTDLKGASKVFFRLGRIIDSKKKILPENDPYTKIIPDIGIVRWDPSSEETVGEIIEKADKLMYEAKEKRKSGLK